MEFSFATAARIVFGSGVIRQFRPLVEQKGRRVLVVGGASPARTYALLEQLSGLEVTRFAVAGEPTIQLAEEGAALARGQAVDVVVAVGGGSVIDAGKAIAALATNGGGALRYLEVIGEGRPLNEKPLPFIAIPTTAGTGAEVTKNAVLMSPEQRVKVSLRSDLMLPEVALIDPELTLGLPAHLTASTGMDALTQVIEPFVSPAANPITDALCREALSLAAWALRRVCADGSDREAREAMALVSLLGGLALANAKLGAVHGFAGPIGGMYDAPHGAVCAALLPHVMRMNISVLRADGSPRLERFTEVAQRLTGSSGAAAEDGAAWLEQTAAQLHIPGLAQYGIERSGFASIIEKARASSSMKGNPVTLHEQQLEIILAAAYQTGV